MRRIVKAFGGELGVVSETGKDSTFWFEIPHVEPSSSNQEAAQAEDALPAGRRIFSSRTTASTRRSPTPSLRSLVTMSYWPPADPKHWNGSVKDGSTSS